MWAYLYSWSVHFFIPANFFWDIRARFLSWECWDFWRQHDHFRRFRRSPKSSEDVRSLPKAKLSRKRLSTKSEIARKVLSFIHFTRGFRSLHGSELTYFWNCVKQDGNNSDFSIRREKLAASVSRREIEVKPKAWELAGIFFILRSECFIMPASPGYWL